MPKLDPTDPWYDPDFNNIDFNQYKEDDEINLPDHDPVIPIEPIQSLNPDVVVVQGDQILHPTPLPAPEPDEPEVVELPDGGTLTFQKTSKGWEAVLDSGTSASPERFKGKNKNEVMIAMASGKLNATKKIRELNREIKLGPGPVAPPAQPTQNTAASRKLTADEVFAVKTKFDSDPDAALSEWFELRTGRSVDVLIAQADKGANADANLQMDAVNLAFIQSNPDYYGDKDFKNYISLVKYLAKYKLHKVIQDKEADKTRFDLYNTGLWTVENLEEAFQELSNDGLLVLAPRSSKPALPVVAPDPEPTPRPSERIVRTETRPRAALGIRTTDITPVTPPAVPVAPSAEDLDSLSDGDIAKLLAGVSQFRRQSRRT